MFLLMLSLLKAIFFLTAHIQLNLNLRTHLSMVRKCFIVNSACVAACILDSFLLLHVMQLFDRSMSSHPPGSWFGLFGLLHFGSFFYTLLKYAIPQWISIFVGMSGTYVICGAIYSLVLLITIIN